MKAIMRFWCSTWAPSTLQYHSIICSRRLVCSTRCDSFFGDGMLSSLECGQSCRIGAPGQTISQQECDVANPRFPQQVGEHVGPRMDGSDGGIVEAVLVGRALRGDRAFRADSGSGGAGVA